MEKCCRKVLCRSAVVKCCGEVFLGCVGTQLEKALMFEKAKVLSM